MRKVIFTLAFFAITSYGFSQKIKVTEGNEMIESLNRTGLYTMVVLDDKKVDKAWEKRLKDFGKVQSKKGTYTVSEAVIPGVSSKPAQIYSKVVKDKDGAKVWWAIDLGTSFVTSSDNHNAYQEASQILSNFAAECYRDDVNEQIEEAEKALNKSVKNHEKEVKEGESLTRSLENNKKEKENLEQKLRDNAEEKKNLESQIEQNKTDQKTANEDVEKMKKAVDVVKAKLEQIGK